jgi:hypothetical protein
VEDVLAVEVTTITTVALAITIVTVDAGGFRESIEAVVKSKNGPG